MSQESGAALPILATSVVNEMANNRYFEVHIIFKANMNYNSVTAN